MSLKLDAIYGLTAAEKADLERLYRAIADGEPQREILEMFFDLFGASCELRPPVAELNLARKCAGEGVDRG